LENIYYIKEFYNDIFKERLMIKTWTETKKCVDSNDIINWFKNKLKEFVIVDKNIVILPYSTIDDNFEIFICVDKLYKWKSVTKTFNQIFKKKENFMLLNVQKYLHNHTLEDLEKKFGIVISRYPDRIVLNYSQIDSPKFHHICDECRGLILSYPDFEVLSRSFDRFYNLNEGNYSQRHKFDILNSNTYTKIDGSLINIYYDFLGWKCATRKMAFAEGTTTRGNTFKSVVEKALGCSVEEKFEDAVPYYTFICEVVSPETRVVVSYKKYNLYLLAVRNNVTGKYVSNEELLKTSEYFGLELPNSYTFNSFDEIVETVKTLEPMEEDGEGYVCYDNETQNRVKIKNPGYVALAHLRVNGAISSSK
jgi:hypothetical protein